jgi:hypothetical protein
MSEDKMADKDTAPTNGEFYDDTRKTWCVWCGPTAVPIRKQDASGKPVPPPETAVLKVSST